jgi:hypothetical protein
LLAERAEWIDSIQTWSLKNYYIREIGELNETLISGTRKDTIISLKPSDFYPKHSGNGNHELQRTRKVY